MDTLPPGNIFGLGEKLSEKETSAECSVEDLSLPSKQTSEQMAEMSDNESTKVHISVSAPSTTNRETGNIMETTAKTELIMKATTTGPALESKVSENAIDMLTQIFPQRKRTVLELILKRCDSDLIKAIENISSNFRDHKDLRELDVKTQGDHGIRSAFKPVYSSGNSVSQSQDNSVIYS